MGAQLTSQFRESKKVGFIRLSCNASLWFTTGKLSQGASVKQGPLVGEQGMKFDVISSYAKRGRDHTSKGCYVKVKTE